MDVAVSFRLEEGSDRRLGFTVDDHDPALPLYIDPTLSLDWSTFLHGGADVIATAAAVSPQDRSVFVVGTSATGGGPCTNYSGGLDAFVVKFDSGGLPSWRGFIGSEGDDWGTAVAWDDAYSTLYVGGISTTSPEKMLLADLDGSGRDDVVFDFGAAGIWANYNDDPASRRQVHVSRPEQMAAGDLDGGGRADLVLDFGAASGVWANLNDDPAQWRQVRTGSPLSMAAGDLDASGQDEVIMDFGPGTGIWANYDNDPAAWRQVHTASCESMSAGDVDGN